MDWQDYSFRARRQETKSTAGTSQSPPLASRRHHPRRGPPSTREGKLLRGLAALTGSLVALTLSLSSVLRSPSPLLVQKCHPSRLGMAWAEQESVPHAEAPHPDVWKSVEGSARGMHPGIEEVAGRGGGTAMMATLDRALPLGWDATSPFVGAARRAKKPAGSGMCSTLRKLAELPTVLGALSGMTIG
jgi:hypothetical protein